MRREKRYRTVLHRVVRQALPTDDEDCGKDRINLKFKVGSHMSFKAVIF